MQTESRGWQASASRRLGVLTTVALLAVGCATSRAGTQVRAAPPQMNVGADLVRGNRIPAGTIIAVRLDRGIDRHTPVGTLYTATVQDALVDGAGRAIVPAGAQVIGHVLQVREGTLGRGPTILLSVESLRANGVTVAIPARVVDMRVPHTRFQTRDAVAGAGLVDLLGLGLGPAGTAAGAGAGAAYSALQERRQADLPAGTLLHIELTRSVPVATWRLARTAG